MTQTTFTRAELRNIVRDNGIENNYLWNDGATTWDLWNLIDALESDDEQVTLSVAGYTDEAREAFTEAFKEAADMYCPGYDYDTDAATESPWCAPWNWERVEGYITTGEGPVKDAYAFARGNAQQITESFLED